MSETFSGIEIVDPDGPRGIAIATTKHLSRNIGTNPKDLLGTDKVPLSRIPPIALLHEGMAMGNGGDKYGPYNWRENAVQADIYIDAALRHILTWFDSSEENSPDSNVHHLGHARACLGIILDAQATGNLIDNRPQNGQTNKVMEKLNKIRKEERAKQNKVKTINIKPSIIIDTEKEYMEEE